MKSSLHKHGETHDMNGYEFLGDSPVKQSAACRKKNTARIESLEETV